MFFWFFFSFIYSVVLPPAFLLSVYNNQKRPANTLKLVLETTYNDLNFKETLVYSAPNTYRVLLEKDDDSILFIRQANNCVGITKSTKIEVACSNYLDNFFYNVFLHSNNYTNYLKKIGIQYDINKTEFELENKSSIKDNNIHLFLYDEKPIYVIGPDEDIVKDLKLNIKKTKNFNKLVLDEIKYISPQVWLDKNSMHPIRYFGLINNKKTEILLKHFQIIENTFVYPRLLEFYDNANIFLSHKVVEIEPKIKINEKLLDVEDYKKRFSKLADFSTFSENKKTLLKYLSANR